MAALAATFSPFSRLMWVAVEVAEILELISRRRLHSNNRSNQNQVASKTRPAVTEATS
jgi:hypothetical protein